MIETLNLSKRQEAYLRTCIFKKIVNEFNNKNKAYIKNPYSNGKNVYDLLQIDEKFLQKIINIELQWSTITETMEVIIQIPDNFNVFSIGLYVKDLSNTVYLTNNSTRWTLYNELQKQDLIIDSVYKASIQIRHRTDLFNSKTTHLKLSSHTTHILEPGFDISTNPKYKATLTNYMLYSKTKPNKRNTKY